MLVETKTRRVYRRANRPSGIKHPVTKRNITMLLPEVLAVVTRLADAAVLAGFFSFGG